jgi:hypothetical protein
LGALRASGEGISSPRDDTSLYAAIGARLGAEAPLGSSSFALGGFADIVAPLRRITFSIDDRAAWTTPAVGAAGGLEVVGHF